MEADVATKPVPFPRIFAVANVIEFFERLAFYGVYVNLQIYLIESVHFSEVQTGDLNAYFDALRAFVPVFIGAVADRITFRRSLLVAFSLYVVAYGTLFAAPLPVLVYLALLGMAVGGAFMKPIITGAVKKYSPPGRVAEGFAIFYAMVNAGSVVGKILAKNVRTLISLRATIVDSIVASGLALGTAFALYVEPEEKAPPKEPIGRILLGIAKSYFVALRDARLATFLAIVSGYYLLIQQFYQTFPIYFVRVVSETAPREYVTLINPLAIALLQVAVAKATRKLDSLGAMVVGVGIGAVSMFSMGLFPNIVGACASFFIFSVAEMVFSPRYYDYVGSFAPKGREGLYMGLALLPFGIGGAAGGFLSGRLIAAHLPKGGPFQPLAVWGAYAAIGIGCAVVLAGYRALIRLRD